MEYKNIENKIKEILKKIEYNNCGQLKLKNLLIDDYIVIELEEIIGVVENSNEEIRRNEILSEIRNLFNDKKIIIEIY